MDKGQAVAVRLLKRGHVFKWFVSGWSLKPVLWSPAPVWARNMYLLLHKLWAWFIFLFCLFFWYFSLSFAGRETKAKDGYDTSCNIIAHRFQPLSWCTGPTARGYWTLSSELTLTRWALLSKLSLSESHHYQYCWISCCMWARLGPKLPAPLLAGHAPPHAARPRLPDSGKHRRSLWLHPLQGHLWCADAHRPAGPAWQVTAPLLPSFFAPAAVICGTFLFYRFFFNCDILPLVCSQFDSSDQKICKAAGRVVKNSTSRPSREPEEHQIWM